MQVKAVLIDVDGTLVDSNERHVRAWVRAFHEAGLDVPPKAVRGQIGKGADHLVPALVPQVDAKFIKRLDDLHGVIFKADHLRRVRAFPGARDFIECISSHQQAVVLASSASCDELRHYIDLLDIDDLVTASTSIDDVPHSKPAADIFLAALKKLGGLDPAAAMVVGDTPYDIAAASAAEIPALGVRSGGFSDRDLTGAVAIYDDVASLAQAYESSPLGA